jgi:hypothetical protein
MGFVADDQTIANFDPKRLELLDLLEQRLRIDDHTIADDAGHTVVQDPGRNQMQHELSAAGVDGMAGVMSTLVAGHNGIVRREDVDDLAFAFISPLCAKHDDVHADQNTPPGVRDQVSGIRCQVSGVRYQGSGIRDQGSGGVSGRLIFVRLCVICVICEICGCSRRRASFP